jgi:hypothetical protein
VGRGKQLKFYKLFSSSSSSSSSFFLLLLRLSSAVLSTQGFMLVRWVVYHLSHASSPLMAVQSSFPDLALLKFCAG